MAALPVLVVHGVANRNRKAFLKQVASLQKGLGKKVKLIPAWWGDRGAPSEHIRLTIPGEMETRARGRARGIQSKSNAEVETIVTAALEAELERHETRAKRSLDTQNRALRRGIQEAWPEVRGRQEDWSEEELQAIGLGVAQALAEPAMKARHEVRGKVSEGVIRSVLHGITAAWTIFKGTALGGIQQTLRREWLPMMTEFLGDVIVYQRHRSEIQKIVRKALHRAATGRGVKVAQLGTKANPIAVIAHSLGGVISFDMATAADPPLYISKLFTMGSQPSFFHIADPRDDKKPPSLAPYRDGKKVKLPKTIKMWRNFWEPLDPFAFIATKVFEGNVHDIRIDHLQSSGLYTHSDYWDHRQVHSQIRSFLDC